MHNIESLTAAQVSTWLAPNAGACLIEFYAKWCIYHLLTIKKLERLHNMLDNQMRAGSFDVVEQEAFVQQFGVEQVPSIVYWDGTQRFVWIGDTDLEVMLADIHLRRTMEHASHE